MPSTTVESSACFKVSRIIGVSIGDGNLRNYQVQWEPSWVSAMHLVGCEKLIEDFVRGQCEDITTEDMDLQVFGRQDNAIEQQQQHQQQQQQQQKQQKQQQQEQKSKRHLLRQQEHQQQQQLESSEYATVKEEQEVICFDKQNFETYLPNAEQFEDMNDRHELSRNAVTQRPVKLEEEEQSSSSLTSLKMTVVNETEKPFPSSSCDEDSFLLTVSSSNTTADDQISPPTLHEQQQQQQLNMSVGTLSTACNQHQQYDSQCKHCLKSLSQMNHPDLHMQTHTREKSSHHEQPMLPQDHMDYHYKNNNNDNNNTNNNNTSTYHTLAHGGGKRYLCDVCGKGFAWKNNLTRHVRTHTGERPFVCVVCGKRFTDPSDCKKHSKRCSNSVVQ